MRIRSIKPEFWRSADVSTLDRETRLLYIGMWSYVDDNGVGLDKLSNIAADLFADDMERDARDTLAYVSRGLQTLSEAGRIVRYTVEGKAYLEVVNWNLHQRIDKPNKPRFPRSNEGNAEIRETLAKVSEKVPSGTGEQRNRGTEEEQPPATPSLEDVFAAAWEHWPKKHERKDALLRFGTAAKRVKRTPEELAAVVIRFGDAYLAKYPRREDWHFIPALGAWLNGDRWNDDLPLPASAAAGRVTPLQRAQSTQDLAARMQAQAEGSDRGITA